jgi:hypothetical protein
MSQDFQDRAGFDVMSLALNQDNGINTFELRESGQICFPEIGLQRSKVKPLLCVTQDNKIHRGAAKIADAVK